MKLLSPSLAALAVSLLAMPALAMDQHQADALCAAGKLECPGGATAPSGPETKTGVLECKAQGRPVKEGPSLTCKDGKAMAWGDWKAGKREGLQVTMRPNGSWTEELFTNGLLEGRSVEYSAEGQLLAETHFQAGKKHGAVRTFKPEDGQLASEEFWDKGVKGKKPAPLVAAKPKPKALASKGATAPADESPATPEEAQTEAAPVTAENPQAPAAESEAPAAKPEDAQPASPQP
jgi:hypothetical protein